MLNPAPTLIALLWAGFYWVCADALPFGTWLAVLLLGTGMAEALTPYISLYHLIGQGKISAERIIEVLDAPVLPVLAPPQTPQDAGVCFEHVSFRYLGRSKNALTDISFTAPAGSFTALVGVSGAGKTTAAQLIGRYWDSSAGTISIGGIPVTELQTENLMALTSFVFQDVFLLEDTLLENIRMGSDASLEEVRKAAQAAQIDDFIMSLPDGYETKIGTEGVKVSGGERQRISIARALVKNAPILIFDEATSYSDIQNEHNIQVALQNLLKGKTVIMIAHRLHTIKNADTIFVFEKGSIAEQGSHTELMNKNGLYAQMQRTYISALNHDSINIKEEN